MVNREPGGEVAERGVVEEAQPIASRIGGRYDVRRELGRGGMACVFQVRDGATGRELALKRLVQQADPRRMREATALFEREFHTLAQLSHPRMIEVYDYGLDAEGPYYTMELLDGGDLRERTPLPWRQACELLFDVCSSLALLHSRRLIHRDVSPRNVRCTHDGHAKLIDFGAMVPMGVGAALVGTPPFVAPEVVYGASLDARTDLFSLGATFYYALTGRLAYPARDFATLSQSWSHKPQAPSALVPGLPVALDRLVLSLVSLEPALRPRSAFEVMQRLGSLAGIQRDEPLSVSRAYLTTPTLVGRDEPLAVFREHMQRAFKGQGAGLLAAAAPGLGRTRLLEACALEAKMLGATVLRANPASAERSDLGVVRALAEQLLEALPDAALRSARQAELFDALFEAAPARDGGPANDVRPQLRSFSRSGAARMELQRALSKWLTQVCRRHPLLVIVDDVDRIDEGSLAWLSALADRARRHPLLVMAAVDERSLTGSSPELEALAGVCGRLSLRPLEPEQTESMLGSVFGDAANLALLAARIHESSGGNPRHAIDLAQHLVDRGVIRYDAGAWTLPEVLAAAELPNAEQAFRARIAALGPRALRLAQAQALALHDAFTLDDFARLEPDADPEQLDRALDELVVQQIVASDGRVYTLAQRVAASALCAGLDDAQRSDRHRALAELHEHSGRPVLAGLRHLFLAGRAEPALDKLLPLLRQVKDRHEFVAIAGMNVHELGRTLLQAFRAALALDRPSRELNDLRYWMTTLSVASDEELYWHAAPAWRERLTRDSGLQDWLQLSAVAEPGPRLMQALQAAAQRHSAAAESERVYAPDEAIRLLVHYVAISIAVGARTLNGELVRSLPQLLEPFAPLSPLVAAIWQNALATLESSCLRQSERARDRWIGVYERLGEITGSDPALILSIRQAVAFGIGLCEASLGLQSAERWAEVLDLDALQKVNAMYLRKVLRLQQGDLDSAERYRKQAELLALQSSSPQMFTNLLTLEIGVHAAAGDLTGVKQIAARIEPLAERHAGWLAFRHLSEGHYQRLRGDLSAACKAYERCLALSTPDPADPNRAIVTWPPATGAYCETLIALGRTEEARDRAERALAECRARELGVVACEVWRALALAEAKLGGYATAALHLDALIEDQLRLGATGMTLGASYEARARIAIWAGDRPAVERFGQLTAQQYRHGHGSPLGARYERLIDEARGAGVPVLPSLSPFESTLFGGTEMGSRAAAMSTVFSMMSGAPDSATRAQRALQLLPGASTGYLYLASETELRLAASGDGAPPDAALERRVNEFWLHQIEDLDSDTAAGGSAADHTQIWTDRRGASYRPQLISTVVDGSLRFVGVAVLIDGGMKTDVNTSSGMLAALARFFVQSGDAVGVQG